MTEIDANNALNVIIVMAKAGCSPEQIALVAEYLRGKEEDNAILELYLKAIEDADRERYRKRREAEIILAAFSSKDKWGRT